VRTLDIADIASSSGNTTPTVTSSSASVSHPRHRILLRAAIASLIIPAEASRRPVARDTHE
jgi:hypothetical protein